MSMLEVELIRGSGHISFIKVQTHLLKGTGSKLRCGHGRFIKFQRQLLKGSGSKCRVNSTRDTGAVLCVIYRCFNTILFPSVPYAAAAVC